MKKTIQDKGKNFRDKEGKLYLVYCYACDRENYSIAVASGECVWCGWGESEDENEP